MNRVGRARPAHTDATRAWLIDASIYIFRAWFSLPDQWHSPQGYPLNAVYGYTRFLLDFLQHTAGTHYCVAAFDESLGTNYRNAIYPHYKSRRVLPDEALAFQLVACREVTERLGLPCFAGALYEADDYLATLARRFQRRNVPVTVVTRDKDLGQLLRNEQDHWWDYARDERLCASGFESRFEVRPDQFADYLALVGDAVDDIPGVPGVGPKTAATLLKAFGSLDNMERDLCQVASLDLRGAARVCEVLRSHWPQVRMARRLTGLEERIPGLAPVRTFSLAAGKLSGLADYLAALGLRGPLTQRCERLAAQVQA
ncbi:MAG: flap endonuclease [Gammaproteobacteria bacterium]|nr:flap endonuclease [Gammaproteobacteria bacterium]